MEITAAEYNDLLQDVTQTVNSSESDYLQVNLDDDPLKEKRTLCSPNSHSRSFCKSILITLSVLAILAAIYYPLINVGLLSSFIVNKWTYNMTTGCKLTAPSTCNIACYHDEGKHYYGDCIWVGMLGILAVFPGVLTAALCVLMVAAITVLVGCVFGIFGLLLYHGVTWCVELAENVTEEVNNSWDQLNFGDRVGMMQFATR